MIVTNYHVIKGMIRGTWRAASDRKHSKVTWTIDSVLNYDEHSDLALLGLDPYDDTVYVALGSRIRPLALASTDSIRPGQTIYVLGNPEGLTGSISQGIVSAAPRQFKEGTRIQVSAPISPGSSGGPVVNSAGEVIGIAQSFLQEGQNLNFAVPASLLSRLLDQTPPIPLFKDWQKASKQRKSEKDWLWLSPKDDDLFDPEQDPYLVPLPQTKPVAEWQLVAAAVDAKYYISRTRIRLTPEHTFIAWTKVVPSDSSEGRAFRKNFIDGLDTQNVNRSYAFSYTMTQQEFDCGQQKKRRISLVDYDKNGELLYDWGDPPSGTGMGVCFTRFSC